MMQGPGLAIAVAVCGAAAVAGCGFGPGPTAEGTATLTVTRDYGSRTVASGEITNPSSSDTVIRFLDREADITTRYGGGFVQSINGLSGSESGGRRYDWFFYVNGTESPVGAADVPVHPGERIWWDYRDWTSAMRVPAVVGSWPAPFAQASTPTASRSAVGVECRTGRAICRTVAGRLSTTGARTAVERPGAGPAGDGPRVVVGPWGAIRRDSAVNLGGPAASGVFATFKPAAGHGPFELVLADPRAKPRCGYRSGAGLVAALGGDPPTWLVTGTDRAGVRRAADALDKTDLHDRYSVAAPPRGQTVGVPVFADPNGGGGCSGRPR